MSERKHKTAAEMNARGWMHIYPQSWYHHPAEIRGTVEALTNLRDALTQAIEGNGIAQATVFANDGEGYAVDIRRINVLNLLGPLPYSGLWDDDKRDWSEARHEAWSQPPEPFNPDEHRVIVYVDADGAVSAAPSS